MTDPGSVEALAQAIILKVPYHADFLRTALGQLTAADTGELAACLGFLASSGRTTERIVESYATIVGDALRCQIDFRKRGTYRHSRYEEVAQAVYFNDDYMDRVMVGIMLSQFFWPHHRQIRHHFRERLPRDGRGAYLEIGPGHGLFFMQAIRSSRYDRYLGVDLSPTSARLTRDVLASGHFGDFPAVKYAIAIGDILDFPTEERFGAVVMGEVLEHVERPGDLLRKIGSLSRDDAFIYVTTVLNAPMPDHIYNFETPEILETLVGGSGLSIVEARYFPYLGLSLERCVSERLPVSAALVLAPDRLTRASLRG